MFLQAKALGRLVLYDRNGALELLVSLFSRGLLGFRLGVAVFVVTLGGDFSDIGDHDVRRDGHILDGLAAGRVILGHGENDSGAIVDLNKLLDGADAKGLFAEDIAASVLEYGGGHHFS